MRDGRLEILGPEHPDTLLGMENLGVTYSRQGRWKEAEALQVQMRDVHLRMLGAEHTDSLLAMGNLAVTYSRQPRWEEAEELQVQVRDVRLRVLPPEHPVGHGAPRGDVQASRTVDGNRGP